MVRGEGNSALYPLHPDQLTALVLLHASDHPPDTCRDLMRGSLFVKISALYE